MNLLMERLDSILIYSFIQIDSVNCWFSMFYMYPRNPMSDVKIKACYLSSAMKTFHRCHPPWSSAPKSLASSRWIPPSNRTCSDHIYRDVTDGFFGLWTAFRICLARVYLTVNYLQPTAPKSHIPDVRVHHFHTWTHWMSTIFPLGWCKFV